MDKAIKCDVRTEWEGKYIELHKSSDDSKKVMVHVADIAVIENDERYYSPTLITLRGSGKKIQVIESYSDVVSMVNKAVDKADCCVKSAKQYVKADTKKYYGVRSVLIDRTTGDHYGVLCNNVDDNYLICVEMRQFGDCLYPWLGSTLGEIHVKDVDK